MPALSRFFSVNRGGNCLLADRIFIAKFPGNSRPDRRSAVSEILQDFFRPDFPATKRARARMCARVEMRKFLKYPATVVRKLRAEVSPFTASALSPDPSRTWYLSRVSERCRATEYSRRPMARRRIDKSLLYHSSNHELPARPRRRRVFRMRREPGMGTVLNGGGGPRAVAVPTTSAALENTANENISNIVHRRN